MRELHWLLREYDIGFAMSGEDFVLYWPTWDSVSPEEVNSVVEAMGELFDVTDMPGGDLQWRVGGKLIAFGRYYTHRPKSFYTFYFRVTLEEILRCVNYTGS